MGYIEELRMEQEGFEMVNPNLYITLVASGGFFSASTYPFLESMPFTLNAPN